MPEEKKYILSLIDNKITLLTEEINGIKSKYSNVPFFTAILNKIEEDYNYKFIFICDLNDSQIDSLLSLLESTEEKQLFKASLISIKGLIDINKSNNSINFEYNDSQIETINKLIELIKRKLEVENEKYNFESKKIEEIINKYNKFKERLNLGLRLELEDFDLVENLLKERTSSNIKASVIIKFLSQYNLAILEQKNNDNYNPFKFNEIEKKPSDSENREALKEACRILGLNYERLNKQLKTELSKATDYKNIIDFAEYLINNSYNKFLYHINICLLLGSSTLNCFKEVIARLEDLELSKQSINSLLKNYTHLFTLEGYNSLKGNILLLDQYNIDASYALIKVPLFLLRSSEENRKGFEKISKYINVRDLFMNVPTLFNMGYDQIVNNIEILINYGYVNLDIQNPSGYTLLGSTDLQLILDRLIELGLNNYIHEKNDESIKMTKSLVIKRVFFSSKNKISAWKNAEDMTEEGFINIPKNKVFENAILLYRKVISEDEITELIKKYSILEEIDGGHRPALYANNDFANLKRRTELVFGNKIISRQKVYSVFKAIMENVVGTNEKVALLYALSYNSLLDSFEYENLKNAVYKDKPLGAAFK